MRSNCILRRIETSKHFTLRAESRFWSKITISTPKYNVRLARIRSYVKLIFEIRDVTANVQMENRANEQGKYAKYTFTNW